MAAYEVPFSAEPQTFLIALAGATYRLTTSWCSAAGHWCLDIARPDNSPVLSGIPIVPGTDLLKQYAYLAIGGGLFVQVSGAPNEIPAYGDLGGSGLVFFVTES